MAPKITINIGVNENIKFYPTMLKIHMIMEFVGWRNEHA